MHQRNIPKYTTLQEKCALVCTFLLQSGALWDMGWCTVVFVRQVDQAMAWCRPSDDPLPEPIMDHHTEKRGYINRSHCINLYFTVPILIFIIHYKISQYSYALINGHIVAFWLVMFGTEVIFDIVLSDFSKIGVMSSKFMYAPAISITFCSSVYPQYPF